MTLIENDLLQIITIFNYTQLILIFTSLRHFTKRFERVNKLDVFLFFFNFFFLIFKFLNF